MVAQLWSADLTETAEVVVQVQVPPAIVFQCGTTVPDASESSLLHLGLATQNKYTGVLADFHFFHHFPEGGTIADLLFTNHPNLLGV